MNTIEINQTDSPKYPPRTFLNAKGTDATLAVAVDFSTAGELLTAKAAGDKIIQIHPDHKPLDATKALWRHMEKKNAQTLNIAGNGIYTFKEHGWSQERINQYIYDVLKELHRVRPIQMIRTGGQTGADWAGAIAAIALNIPAIITYPNGYIRKFADGSTKKSTVENLLDEMKDDVAKLNQSNENAANSTPSRTSKHKP